ncbi:MAG: OB-fold domain-containing protein [Deltaproteobacteria bacterium]
MGGERADYKKPLPSTHGLGGEFYAWCRKGELRFQRCSDCEAWRHVPREMCAECGSFDWSWQASSGRGRLFTWTVATYPLHPAFKDDTPYASCVVELEEGVRVVTQITDCSPEELEMDMAVEVVFDEVSEEISLPKFTRSKR